MILPGVINRIRKQSTEAIQLTIRAQCELTVISDWSIIILTNVGVCN